MTVCVGIVDQLEGKVYIGADSRCHDGQGQLWERKTPKAWVDGSLAFAAAGNPAVGNMLRTEPLPALPEDPSGPGHLMMWANTALVDRLQEVAQRLKLKDDDRWTLMVGGYGRLFLIDSWYDVLEPADGIATSGSGGPYAAGALTALRAIDHIHESDAEARIKVALGAACRHDISCAPPITVVCV